MVLEYILSAKNARDEPYKLLPVTMLYMSVGVAVYLLIPGLGVTPLMLALIPLLPLMLRLLMWEEKNEEISLRRHTSGFFEYHQLLLESFAFVFVGAMLATTIWYQVLPADASANAFGPEMKEIGAIQDRVTATNAGTGNILKSDFFSLVFWNNMQVLALMVVFSLLYGVGSLYLLLWNASILGVFTAISMQKSGLLGFFIAFLGLFPHGIFEVSAYFIASVAGGIFSIAIMRRKKLDRPELLMVLLDVGFLIALSVLLLFIGAVFESSY